MHIADRAVEFSKQYRPMIIIQLFLLCLPRHSRTVAQSTITVFFRDEPIDKLVYSEIFSNSNASDTELTKLKDNKGYGSACHSKMSGDPNLPLDQWS